MGRRTTNPHQRGEHLVSVWLYESGYTRHEIAKMLRISFKCLHQVLKHPKVYMTCDQLQIISHATGKDILTIVKSIFYNRAEPRHDRQKWHEEPTNQ